MPKPMPFPALLPDAASLAPLRSSADTDYTLKSVKSLSHGLLAVLDSHSAQLLARELWSVSQVQDHVSAKTCETLGNPVGSEELTMDKALCVPAPQYGEDTANRYADGIERAGNWESDKNEQSPDIGLNKSGSEHLIQIDDVFRHLDLDRDGFLSPDEFHGEIDKLSRGRLQRTDQFDSALSEIRHKKPFLFSNTEDTRISTKLFEELLIGDISYLSSSHYDMIMTFRRICVDERTRDDVAKRICLDSRELLTDADEVKRGLTFWLEPISGFAILLNAVCIGASIDFAPESMVWFVLEGLFTLFFLLELLVKLNSLGIKHFLFGRDWKWNLFDVAIVALATYDVVIVLVLAFREIQGRDEGAFGNLTILRAARVLRVTRIVRLVRIRALKDLTLMINGIFSGLRTLFWAFILLFSFVYASAVFLHQWMAEWKARTDCSDRAPCSPSEQVLYDMYDTLFSNLFRSCMTVLRCFCGDCSLPNGTPMEPYLLETQGSLLVVCFTCAYLFVIFGIVNLIAAVFVDNTIQSSTQDHMKRYQLRKKEHIKMARSLHSFIRKITKTGVNRKSVYQKAPEIQDPFTQGLRRVRSWFAITEYYDDGDEDDGIHVSVSKDIFEDAMIDPEAEDMLDRLGVSITNRGKLFDILDSDGNGFLTVDEIVDGLMRLRGPADKGDIVSASLMIRSLQRSFAELHSMCEDLVASRPAKGSGII
eukprot:TRINITY_DN2591_c0_g1_i2.p1 TRINITY_DN2591_c0_g1~~TRINITY_DN2591_c0_g1_i2.p1  ORF type:complete len:707 (-),score=78.70 TRINITY_DN2591_c0_g1_i2:203-2323(-)